MLTVWINRLPANLISVWAIWINVVYFTVCYCGLIVLCGNIYARPCCPRLSQHVSAFHFSPSCCELAPKSWILLELLVASRETVKQNDMQKRSFIVASFAILPPPRHIIKQKYWYKHETNLTFAIIWNIKVRDYSSQSWNAIQGWSLPIIFFAWKCSDAFHKTDLNFGTVLLKTTISGP